MYRAIAFKNMNTIERMNVIASLAMSVDGDYNDLFGVVENSKKYREHYENVLGIGSKAHRNYPVYVPVENEYANTAMLNILPFPKDSNSGYLMTESRYPGHWKYEYYFDEDERRMNVEFSKYNGGIYVPMYTISATVREESFEAYRDALYSIFMCWFASVMVDCANDLQEGNY